MQSVPRFVQLSFGRLVVSSRGFPVTAGIPRAVEAELCSFADSPSGSRALADLLDAMPSSAAMLVEQTMHALDSGRLSYEPWRATPRLVSPPDDEQRLAGLVADEPAEIAIHAVVLELVDVQDRPVRGAQYLLVDPEGRTHRGVLDDHGRAELRELRKPGACKVCFPEFDDAAWSYVSAHPL